MRRVAPESPGRPFSSRSSTAPTFDEVVQDQLGLPGGDSSEFRQFASFYVARQKIAETLVTTDTVRQQVTDQVMAEASKTVQKGTVAHILISVPQGADAATDAAALAKAHRPEAAEDLDPNSPHLGLLAFDELLASQLALSLTRAHMRRSAGHARHGDGRITRPILDALPFDLTGSQERAIAEIVQPCRRNA